MFCCRLVCHDTLEVPQFHRGGGDSVFVVYLEHVLLSTCLPRHSRSTTVPQGGRGVVYLLFIWNMFCCRLACHDRGGGGSIFVIYLEHVLLSTCLPRHSRSTTISQGGAGVVYLLFIWNMFYCRLNCHDTLEVPQYHRGGRGVVILLPSWGGGSHGPAILHHICLFGKFINKNI